MKPKIPKTEINNRKTIFAELSQFCVMSKEHDFIEITEWSNGEGWDVHINAYDTERFGISHGQYDALKCLIKKLNKDD